jgi:hypothetical protein
MDDGTDHTSGSQTAASHCVVTADDRLRAENQPRLGESPDRDHSTVLSHFRFGLTRKGCIRTRTSLILSVAG